MSMRGERACIANELAGWAYEHAWQTNRWSKRTGEPNEHAGEHVW